MPEYYYDLDLKMRRETYGYVVEAYGTQAETVPELCVLLNMKKLHSLVENVHKAPHQAALGEPECVKLSFPPT